MKSWWSQLIWKSYHDSHVTVSHALPCVALVSIHPWRMAHFASSPWSGTTLFRRQTGHRRDEDRSGRTGPALCSPHSVWYSPKHRNSLNEKDQEMNQIRKDPKLAIKAKNQSKIQGNFAEATEAKHKVVIGDRSLGVVHKATLLTVKQLGSTGPLSLLQYNKLTGLKFRGPFWNLFGSFGHHQSSPRFFSFQLSVPRTCSSMTFDHRRGPCWKPCQSACCRSFPSTLQPSIHTVSPSDSIVGVRL